MSHLAKEEIAPGEESVWDYPRPPRLEPCSKHVEVLFNGVKLADTRHAYRVLETSHPPVYYIPPSDVRMEHLVATSRLTVCEWKGRATYYTVKVGDHTAKEVAWSYPDPAPEFEQIAGYVAFYPAPMDSCLVDGERVRPQPGDFYAGWITHDIKGPFKGEAGTMGW